VYVPAGVTPTVAAACAAPELIIATAAAAATILRFNFIDPVSPWMVDWLANVRPPVGYLQFLLVVHNSKLTGSFQASSNRKFRPLMLLVNSKKRETPLTWAKADPA